MMTTGEFKNKLDEAVEHFKTELSQLRTGRASPALVDDLDVDYYGTKTPIKAIAAISCPEPRQLVIQPWDKNAIQAIEKAIQSSHLGLAPITERDVIRLTIPLLTEERRKDLLKLVSRYAEDARIRIRRDREEIMKEVDGMEKQKEISEDEKFRQRDAIQKLVDEINKKIEDVSAAKEKEIMTV